MATGGKQVRGRELVAKVLGAAIAEMASVGPENLSIENVAVRAGVNKTTIYRRWPTPMLLARDALQCATEKNAPPPDTGSLRGDLSAFARAFRRVAAAPGMQTIIRLRFGAPSHGRFAALTGGLEEQRQAQFRSMLDRAVARGELPQGTDTGMLHDIVVGTLLYLLVLANRRSGVARLEHAMQLICSGAACQGGAKRRRPARAPVQT